MTREGVDRAIREIADERVAAGMRKLEGRVARLETVVKQLAAERATGRRKARLASAPPNVLAAKKVTQPPSLEVDLAGAQLDHRPSQVNVLFIAPPIRRFDASVRQREDEPLNFYSANSHIFRCVRGAYARAFEEGAIVPNGTDFLDFFKERSAWVVRMPARLTRGRGRPRLDRTQTEAEFLAALLRSSSPRLVIGVESSVRLPLTRAVAELGLDAETIVVRTPRDLFQDDVVRRIRSATNGTKPDPQRVAEGVAEPHSVVVLSGSDPQDG